MKTTNREATIIVATHKKYRMPRDRLYLPLQVGAAGKPPLGYPLDSAGRNISRKNPNFCELTGLYWAWQNLRSDYIGLVHYRRHFTTHRFTPGQNKFPYILKTRELQQLLQTNAIILPKKRRYFIENLYSHYTHTLFAHPLDLTGEIIKEKYPDYYPEFQKLHHRTSAHMFNMFIMRRDLLDDYCTWLFGILFELEKRLGSVHFSAFHARFYGRISELLLDVYLNTRGLTYIELPVVSIEKTNWPRKIRAFLTAKFKGVRYEESF